MKRRVLPNGIEFNSTPITKAYYQDQNSTTNNKYIPKDLANVLANPVENPPVQPGKRKIYLGDGAINPQELKRYPIYLSPELLFLHILIAGAINSGKTSLLLRLLAGIINTGNSVVISEAKAGKNGGQEGAAFTDISKYLNQKFTFLQVYRWPRGNCTFNPLLYLKTAQDRRGFLDALCNQIVVQNNISGDMMAYLYNAASITELIIAYLQEFSSPEKLKYSCTLSNVVKFLRKPIEINKEISKQKKVRKEQLEKQNPNHLQQQLQREVERLQQIGMHLELLNFFFLTKPEFAMTRHGVNILANLFDHQDLIYYSQPHANLPELTLDRILYNRCLVIISQPLYDPSSKVVGPLFWDSLLAKIIELGPNPLPVNGKPRQKVVAILDETHRLPVGRLGESGDFLREYQLGLVEITPTIVDEQRWLQNKHVYQTLISLSPGVPQVVELMQSRLPNFFLKGSYLNTSLDAQGQTKALLSFEPNYKYKLSEDNPGVSLRSLQMTGRFTGLLQSAVLDGQGKVFWIDFEHELLANMKRLLKDALAPNCPQDIKNAVDYVLGLAEYNSSTVQGEIICKK
ncbi:MAG: hypothetical protein AB4426_04160 [Xenococcaceae cyanobacterium]